MRESLNSCLTHASSGVLLSDANPRAGLARTPNLGSEKPLAEPKKRNLVEMVKKSLTPITREHKLFKHATQGDLGLRAATRALIFEN